MWSHNLTMASSFAPSYLGWKFEGVRDIHGMRRSAKSTIWKCNYDVATTRNWLLVFDLEISIFETMKFASTFRLESR